jgi:hypothetical protein
VEEAAESVLGDEAESLRLARQQLEELIRQVNDDNRRQLTDPNDIKSLASGRPRPSESQIREGEGRQLSDSAQQSERSRASANVNGGGNQAGSDPNNPAQQSSQRSGSGRQTANAGRGGNQAGSEPNNPAQQGSQRRGSERQTADARTGRGGNTDGRSNPNGWGGGLPGQWEQNDPNGLFTGRDFGQWSDRLRDVEEMLTERELREEAARIRGRARSIRAEFVRHGKEPQWDLVQKQITNPLTELRKHLSDKLAQLQSDEALVPIDRDPVPGRFAELVRRYYENLGGGD